MQKVREYALKMLGRREFSVFEFQKKLEDVFPDRLDEIQEVEKEFIAKKWLSDERFTEMYIEYELKRAHSGQMKIMQKLRQKGIDEDLVKEKLAKILPEDQEKESAHQLAQKKKEELLRRNKGETDFEINQKIVRFLVAKGYSFDVASRAVRERGSY